MSDNKGIYLSGRHLRVALCALAAAGLLSWGVMVHLEVRSLRQSQSAMAAGLDALVQSSSKATEDALKQIGDIRQAEEENAKDMAILSGKIDKAVESSDSNAMKIEALRTQASTRNHNVVPPYAFLADRAGRQSALAMRGANAPAARLFLDLPAGTEAEFIGVYESAGQNSASRPPDVEGNRYGEITVNISKKDKPVLLVLTSYEPVRWIIRPDKDVKIAGVITSGFYKQSVDGISDGVTVQNLSRGMSAVPYFYGYQEMAPEVQVGKITVEQLTGISRDKIHFQGVYRGSDFTVQ